ncbi:MAG: type II secretion system protein GspH [Syntrophobacterales bacterium RBG_19FT_COMBO_59_10]|nr:MAG: type II secretion system protein GspH [Syntrophobacterales bacterium RBG_19FT_COMBO_59_10]
MRIRKGNGFTLLELMIVIAIMGIMTTIAIPSYQTFMAQRRLNGAAREMMSDLMAARMQAIAKNNRFRVFVLDATQYQILDDANNNNAVDTGETTQTKNIQTNYHDVTLSKTADPIFNPRGTANLGATITVTNSRGSKGVIVAPNGRVRISDTP